MSVIIKEIETKKTITVYVLNQFDIFCKKNDIKYCIYYGTLLGAIRHKGYIPWDDDIDVAMTWNNYKKLLSLENDLPEGFAVYNSFNDKNYMNIYGSVFSTKRISSNFDGIGIDIFPITKYVDNLLVNKSLRLAIRSLSIISYGKCMYNYENDLLAKKMAKLIINKLFKFVSYRKLSYIYNRLIDKVESSDFNYKYLTYINEIKCKKIPKKCFNETIEVRYENKYFPAPKYYNEILTINYGNYMEFPPLNERRYCHNYEPTEISDKVYREAMALLKCEHNEK